MKIKIKELTGSNGQVYKVRGHWDTETRTVKILEWENFNAEHEADFRDTVQLQAQARGLAQELNQ